MSNITFKKTPNKPTGKKAPSDVSRSAQIAKKLGQVAPDDDPAEVAGAIAIFATETIKRSANNLPEARAYLQGLRDGIDGLLKNAFPEKTEEQRAEDAEKAGDADKAADKEKDA